MWVTLVSVVVGVLERLCGLLWCSGWCLGTPMWATVV